MMVQSISKLQEAYLNYQKTLQSEQIQKLKPKFQKMFGCEVFGILVMNQVSQQLIDLIIQKYSKVKFHLDPKQEISEEEYNKIVTEEIESVQVEDQQVYMKLMKIIK